MYSAINPLLDAHRRSFATSSGSSSSSTSDSDNSQNYSLPGTPPSLAQYTMSSKGNSQPNITSPSRPTSSRIGSPTPKVALDSALASPEDGPTVSPLSLDHKPASQSRSQSRPVRPTASPVPASRLSSSAESSNARRSLDSGRLSPPEILARDRSYSPMAASFARLSVKDEPRVGTTASRGRSAAAKSSLELGARLFEGPA